MTEKLDIQISINDQDQFSIDRLETLVKEVEIIKSVKLRYSVRCKVKNLDPTIRARRIKVNDEEGIFRYEIGDYAIHEGAFILLFEDGYQFNNGKLEDYLDFGSFFWERRK